MIYLTPDHVREMLGCSKRSAIAAIRVAGGWTIASSEDWRITDETFEAFRDHPEMRLYSWRTTDALPVADFVRRESWAYLVQCGELVKIGSTTDIAARLAQLRTMGEYPVQLRALLSHGELTGLTVERALHAIFWRHRDHDEWFHKRGDLDAFVDRVGA